MIRITGGIGFFQEWDRLIRETGYIFVDGPVSLLSTENQGSMETTFYSRELNAEKKALIEEWMTTTDSTEEVVNSLKAIKKAMNTGFGESHNQITKCDIEGIMESMYVAGYDGYSLNRMTDKQVNKYLDDRASAFSLVIHFPDITISNSRKQNRQLKDLYVKCMLRKECKFVGHLNGLRTTFTKEEHRAGYIHSHLPSGEDPHHWGYFCLGTGEINQVLALLGHKFDEVNFTLFCIHLNNYVRWESLEGSPHCHMENVGVNRRHAVGQLGTSSVKQVVDILKKHAFSEENLHSWIKEKFKFAVTPMGIEVTPNIEFDEWAGNVIDKLSLGSLKDIYRYAGNADFLLCLKDTIGNSFALNITEGRNREANTTLPILKFKGEDKFLKIIETDSEIIKNIKYANPQIVQEFCRSLNREFTKIAIGVEAAKIKEYTACSEQAVTGSDLFPL